MAMTFAVVLLCLMSTPAMASGVSWEWLHSKSVTRTALPLSDHIGKLALGPIVPMGKITVRTVPADRYVPPGRVKPQPKQTSPRAAYNCDDVRWYAARFTPDQLDKMAKSFGHTITEADRRAAAACFK